MASQDWLEKDFYAELGVPSDASKKDIDKAYRKLARQYHPDNNDSPEAEDRFKAISEAYSVLHDEKQRAEYDEIQLMKSGRGGFGGMGGSTGGFNMDDVFSQGSTSGDFGDIFGNLFGGMGGGRGRRGPKPGHDLRTHMSIDFTDAVKGTTHDLRMRAPGVCDTCHGSGAAPGTSPETCRLCHGGGMITVNQGGFSFQQTCPDCGGSGSVVPNPCPECGGSGAVTKDRVITVRIPAGVRDGQTIRLAGRGAPGERGGPTGDLMVDVHVRSHAIFGRDGNNLTLRLPVTYTEAALGAKISVPTLDETVTMRVPAGTPSGRVLRVKGRGVPGKGDLMVTVDVDVPTKLGSEAKEALEKYASVEPPTDRSKLQQFTAH
ncbi:molecular chaperone DnaJ [Haloglycomyces albus]|uniref:molecular chaperone DnaJ n=1 Tax=Haloglycomyces albus TaxID=526067 RepID=UPI00046CEEA5|nr:molecular chaperone DnaJ [Haloglycomyces albus]